MNTESIRKFCLALPLTTEDMAFGEEYMLFRVCGKIFVCYGFELSGSLSDEFIESLIRHSYGEVVWKLPKRIKDKNPEITEIH